MNLELTPQYRGANGKQATQNHKEEGDEDVFMLGGSGVLLGHHNGRLGLP